MRQHKIINSINVLTIDQLTALGINKGDAFCNLTGGSLDYALPQPWLDAFASWCESQKRYEKITYHLILSTTVWYYPPYTTGNSGPVTCCAEVYRAYKAFEEGVDPNENL